MACSSSRSLARRSISSRSIASARSSLSTPCRLNTRTSTMVPCTPGGTRSEVSRTSEAFSPKMARKSFSSGVIGLSPFVEVFQRFFRDVRNVAGDFLRAELGVAGHHLEFLDVDRGEDVVLHNPLREQGRIFGVVAV